MSRIKGSHAAIKTGMLAADAAYDAVVAGRQQRAFRLPGGVRAPWLHAELNKDRNYKTWFKKGLTVGTLMTGIEQKLFAGHMPWTVHRHAPDYALLDKAAGHQPIDYPRPDGKLTFDRLSSVFISNTNHEENQPAHLTLKDPTVPVRINRRSTPAPSSATARPACTSSCPTKRPGAAPSACRSTPRNCVHCKTCDIKDPTQNIVWVTPEGGGGPNYSGM